MLRALAWLPLLGGLTPPPRELRMIVGAAGPKGSGAFAGECRAAGAWVCDYEGEVIDFATRATRYCGTPPEYLFHIGGGALAGSHVYVDGAASGHASAAINHAQNSSLTFEVSLGEPRVAFYAARDLETGDELTFDYGEAYWLERGVAPCDDDRDYSPARVARDEAARKAAPRAADPRASSPGRARVRRAPALSADALAALLRERPDAPPGM